MIEVSEILAILAKQRSIFHSEADFQHAFAWEIHKNLPSASVRLEFPIQVRDQFLHIDVWVVNHDEVLGVELKYKTRGISVQVDNEKYRLRNQSAQDTGRYDFVKDVQRLEHVGAAQRNFVGYAILLTNDSAYWIKPRTHNTVDADFRIHDGRTLEGVFKWSANASAGTKKNREQPITLQNRYLVQWEKFSRPSPSSYGSFRSLTIRVTRDQNAG